MLSSGLQSLTSPLKHSTITYAGLREKLNKIMEFDYFTTTPEMRAPVEAADASGTYGSFQVPVHGEPSAVDLPEPVQGSLKQSQHREVEVVDPQGEGVYDDQTSHLEDVTQGDAAEISAKLPKQTEASTSEVEPNLQELYKGQHHTTRRPFQDHRGGRTPSGGGRRGHPDGRGGSRGGSYGDGRQYYDHPRSHYRGRGGRGAGGSYPGQGSYLVGDA